MPESPITIGQAVRAHARLQPDKMAVRDFNRTLSYRQWNERSRRLANAIAGHGLTKGDRIAVFAYNRIEWAEIYLAAAKSGVIAVPINFRLTGPEVQFILEDSGASMIFAEQDLIPLIESIRDNLKIEEHRLIAIGSQTPHSGWQDYEKFLLRGTATESVAIVSADDPWCLMYTSGTTGNPKGAIRDHRGMSMLALMTAVELKLHRKDDALIVMPMFHANSLNFFTSFTYAGGGATIYSRKGFDPELCLRTFAQTGATFTSMVPTHYTMLLDVPASNWRVKDLDRVEKLMISSAPARADTKRAVMEMFANSGLYELYGSTEAGWVTMLHPDEQFEKLGTVGREVIGSQPIQLIDDDGNEVEDGSPGELFSCSPYTFSGYWKLPEKTAEVFRGDYLTVGDIALRDEDGFIRLIDRKKNLIISGGENIYPSEVETILASHPDIREVAVIGLPDPKWGESVQAAVVRVPGSNINKKVLMAWTKDRLAGYKRPREIVFLTDDEMPRNATGKILHRKLRDTLAKRSDINH